MQQLNLKDIFGEVNKRRIFKNKDTLKDRYTPETVPHRETEIRQLALILAPALRGDSVSNIFCYGTVGTGKTLSVKFVTNELKNMSSESDKDVNIVYINCKKGRIVDTEYRLLAQLIRELGSDVPHTGLPTDTVYQRFFEILDSEERILILILDEIDALIKKIGDEILYNMSRINQDLDKAKLNIIGISNDLSFTNNMDPRVRSSLSEEEIIFPPYNAVQLQDILNNRAGEAFNEGVIEQDVISKCAALAAQEHGDARRALDLLRVAGEISERSNSPKVGIEHVNIAQDKIDSDRVIEVVKTQPKQSQAVLAGVIKAIETGNIGIHTGDVYSFYEKICMDRGLKTLTQRRVTDLLGELDMLGIINARVISKGRYGRTKEIKVSLGESLLDKVKAILEDNFLM